MLIDFISHHHSDKLGNSGKQQVSMQRFLILGLPASNAKTIFKVVDGFSTLTRILYVLSHSSVPRAVPG